MKKPFERNNTYYWCIKYCKELSPKDVFFHNCYNMYGKEMRGAKNEKCGCLCIVKDKHDIELMNLQKE